MQDRRTAVALWAVAALVGVLLVVVLLHDRRGPRDDVADYIRRVNAAQVASARDYRVVDGAYRSFSLRPERLRRQVPKLRHAADELTRLRVRTARIAAPPQASALRLGLVAYLRKQESIARDLVGLALYFPRLTAAEQPLPAASKRMQSALRGGRSGAEQAAALGAYADALDRVGRTLDGIRPPALFERFHRTQVERVRRSASLVRGRGRGLAANDRPAMQAAIANLGKVNSGSSDAARRAILAYNKELTDLHALAAAVERERKRLADDLA